MPRDGDPLKLNIDRVRELAEPLLHRALETQARVLGEEHPDTLWTLGSLVDVYHSQGRYEEAEPLVRRLLDQRRARAEQPDASPDDKNEYAWQLLTCEPATLRDPETAMGLALEANDMTGHENPGYLKTLALACHLTGDTAEAIENQKKAIALLSPGESDLRADLEAALARFESAIAEQPGDPAQETTARDQP